MKNNQYRPILCKRNGMLLQIKIPVLSLHAALLMLGFLFLSITRSKAEEASLLSCPVKTVCPGDLNNRNQEELLQYIDTIAWLQKRLGCSGDYNFLLSLQATACIEKSQTLFVSNRRSEALHQASLAIDAANKSEQLPLLSDAHFNMAKLYMQLEMHKQAACHHDTSRQLLQKAYRIIQRKLGSAPPRDHKQQPLIFGLICFALLLLFLRFWRDLHYHREAMMRIIQMIRGQSIALEEEKRKSVALQQQFTASVKAEATASEHREEVQPADNELYCSSNGDEEKYDELYTKVVNWLEEGKRYTQPNITLFLAARELGTNRSYLSKAIAVKQLHFSSMLNKCRLEEAARLLSANPQWSLDYIAVKVGFNHYPTFTAAVKRETNLAPSQWRDFIIHLS